MTSNIFGRMLYLIWAPISTMVAYHFISIQWPLETLASLAVAAMVAILIGGVVGSVIGSVGGSLVKQVIK